MPKPLELQQTVLYRTMPTPSGTVHPNPSEGEPFAVLSISDLDGRKLTSAYYFTVEDIQTHINALVKLRNDFADALAAKTTPQPEADPL